MNRKKKAERQHDGIVQIELDLAESPQICIWWKMNGEQNICGWFSHEISMSILFTI